jgi:branched-chain amino acid transport system ATP-binding protein
MSLVVDGLTRRYGGVLALRGVSFEVTGGECVALIGPNGAGKSTCFACIAGQLAPDAGRVTWQDRSLGGLSPAQRLHAGVARTFQLAQTFEALTVLENVVLVLDSAAPAWLYPPHLAVLRDRARALLEPMGLDAQAGQRVGQLSYGARKRLELAMALAGLARRPQTDAGLLLLDEPAAGLAQAERVQLMCQIKAQAAAGCAVLYTEHNMDAVFGVADRVLVLVDGQLVAQGDPATVAQDSVVRARYLGATRLALTVQTQEGAAGHA